MSFVILIGPSGSGKTTIIKKLSLKKIASYTTRPKRSIKDEGYIFCTEEEFLDKIKKDQISAHNIYDNNHYGIDKKYLNKTPEETQVLTLEPKSALEIKNKYVNLCFKIIYIKCCWREIIRRLKKRNMSRLSIKKRIKEDKKQLQYCKKIKDRIEVYSNKNMLKKVKQIISY